MAAGVCGRDDVAQQVSRGALALGLACNTEILRGLTPTGSRERYLGHPCGAN